VRNTLHSTGCWFIRYYSLLLLLVLWEALARSGLVNPRLFPSLIVIIQDLWTLIERQIIFSHLTATLLRMLIGFILATVTGIVLGFLMARSEFFSHLFEPLFSFGYPVPRVALYPMFVLIFGLGHASKIALVFLECLYPITVHTYHGARAIPVLYLWAARNMGATPMQVFFRVMLPATAPSIFSGLRIALPIALVVVIIAEMVSATEGLGWLIAYASASLSRSQIFAAVAVIMAIGFVLDRLLGVVRNRLVFWERESVSIG